MIPELFILVFKFIYIFSCQGQKFTLFNSWDMVIVGLWKVPFLFISYKLTVPIYRDHYMKSSLTVLEDVYHFPLLKF